MRTTWHMITPEYPPQLGGVSDYAAQVAAGLRAAGDEVQVWCHSALPGGVLGGVFSKLRSLDAGLGSSGASQRLLVQWVPHGYGWSSMNVPFCLWLWRRARRGDRVELMVHEAYLQFGLGGWRKDAVAAVHRLMTVIVLRAACKVWMSTGAWEPLLRPFALGRRLGYECLAVPSNIIPVAAGARVPQLKRELAPSGGPVVGHFGTFGRLTTEMLDTVIPQLLERRADIRFVLIGGGGKEYRTRLLSRHPALAPFVVATGRLSSEDVSRHLLACDVLVQPYPEGITARRTSAVAGLAHARPVVTTRGEMTEGFWAESGGIELAPDAASLALTVERVLGDAALAARLAERGLELYRDKFDLGHAIQSLRQTSEEREPCLAPL